MNTQTRSLMMASHSRRLRELASWYRERADDTENPWTRTARLRTAEDLDEEAERIDRKRVGRRSKVGTGKDD
jgi:hypothetical protein